MRGTVDPEDLLFDPKIEKSARARRRRRRLLRDQERAQQEQQALQTPPLQAQQETLSLPPPTMGEPNPPRTLGAYAMPNADGYGPSIVRPAIQANNFEIKPAFLQLVQQDQFGGGPLDDPNLHISNFLQLCDTIKANGVSEDAIRLRLFPFSLRDKAKSWLQSQPQGSISTWDELVTKFLTRYFPPSKLAKMRSEITSFV